MDLTEIELPFRTLEWKADRLTLIDQRALPSKVNYIDYYNYRDIIVAIKNLTVRGAPAIGAAAGFAMVLASIEFAKETSNDYLGMLRKAADEIISARPTAVNLRWAVERIWKAVSSHNNSSVSEKHKLIEDEAIAIEQEDKELCRKIGEYGAKLIDDGDGVLTHCNAGALATAGIGTALGVIYTAAFGGKDIKIYSGETRPIDQGRRLTTWELAASGLDVTLLCDNMIGSLMRSGKVQEIVVGADRVAANGDTANKIGTFNIALIADYFDIPFYVAAPYSTFDPETPTGEDVPIEFRSPEEIIDIEDYAAIKGSIHVYNAAFDITPHELIAGYITDRGVVKASEIEQAVLTPLPD
ncbi:MAG: S-methyl-5-thioribose-1-phosphate isomerase [candidate division Zixibacteria bacterium]|nr:S-methyl-5-thioribose-1-phosphate isomerase [candidate division Zixibacteria bacterium]